MSLNADIQNLIAAVRPTVPPQVFQTLGNMLARLEADGVAGNVPRAGAKAPDVRFVGPEGKAVELAALYAQKPLVLLFYRGRWCPFCDLTLRAFEQLAPEFAAAGVGLMAVSPQPLFETEQTGTERQLSYVLYSDPGNAASHAFGLDWQVHEGTERALYHGFGSHVDQANGDDEWRLPAPAAFVIDTQGVVRWGWADSNWTRRPEPADVLAAAKVLTAS